MSQFLRSPCNPNWAVFALLAVYLFVGAACKSSLRPPQWSANNSVPTAAPVSAMTRPRVSAIHNSLDNESALPSTGTTSIAPPPDANQIPSPAVDSILAGPSRAIATSSLLLDTSFTREIQATPLASLGSTVSSPASTSSVAFERPVTSIKPVIRLVITGVRPERGSVKVAVYTAANEFPNPASTAQTLELAATQATLEATLTITGRFAIAVYQDINVDGELNRNRFGIPLEPFAFSNGAMGERGPPTFDQAAVAASAGDNTTLTVAIKLP